MFSNWYRHRGKRALDALVAATLGLALLPLLALLAVLVRLGLGSPVLFRQQRPGLHGRPFTLLKFRTMRYDRDWAGNLLPDAERMTRLGRLLRATSLDELPSLWCVLRGEMSLVGPRPLLMRYLDRYTPQQARRHEVRPGITGAAQVNGRNRIDWETKFAHDIWYVDHCGPWVDLGILLRTLLKVAQMAEVSAPGHATSPEYLGPAVLPMRPRAAVRESSAPLKRAA